MEKCTHCGKETPHLMIFVEQNTGKKDYLCPECIAETSSNGDLPAENLEGLRKLDAMIEGVKHDIQRSAEMFKGNSSSDTELPEDDPLSQFVMSPRMIEIMFKQYLDRLYKDRENLLNSLTEEEVLQYELNKAVGEEDYEKAEKLKKEMQQKGFSPDQT